MDTKDDAPVASSFLDNILTPGSSLNPTFLAILDGAFVCLFLVLLLLAYLTSGNPHIFALTGIGLCLWASVKWFVNELENNTGVGIIKERESESKKDL